MLVLSWRGSILISFPNVPIFSLPNTIFLSSRSSIILIIMFYLKNSTGKFVWFCILVDDLKFDILIWRIKVGNVSMSAFSMWKTHEADNNDVLLCYMSKLFGVFSLLIMLSVTEIMSILNRKWETTYWSN
jgi:hypothetical protein